MKKKPHFFTVIKRYYFLYLSFGADGSGHGRIVLSGNTNKLCLPEQESFSKNIRIREIVDPTLGYVIKKRITMMMQR